jgi:ABC-2 type transport system permease protein
MTFFLNNVASLQTFFYTTQLLMIIYIPIVTMNLISGEKQNYTIELMFTLPISVGEFIIGKFLTAMTIFVISIAPSLFYFSSILYLGHNVDIWVVWCGYLSLILTAGVYCAIGIFSSAVSANQIVAFLVAVGVILVFFLLDVLIRVLPIGLAPVLSYISIAWQQGNLVKGVLDSRVLIYFFSLIGLFLYGGCIWIRKR